MNIKKILGQAVGIAAAVVICWLGLTGVAEARSAQPLFDSTGTTTGCVIRTFDGHLFTAVNGGGVQTNAIHTNVYQIGSWEKFSLVGLGVNGFAIQTINGHWLTAVGGGGLTNTNDAIHTDATVVQTWERFTLVNTGINQYAIRTWNGYYLTAVDGGGRTTETTHTNATQILGWETYTITCGN
jgi:hypothetical protein